MTEDASPALTVKRSFRDLSDAEVAEMENLSALARAGWRRTCGWDELLKSHRVLIVSEAGAGKTYECQAQQAKLWKAGEPAFFLDLATLAGSSVREMLSQAEEERLDAWLRSQSEIATFFLDSIDELKLTLGKFDQALVRLGKSIAGHLGRARIIVTTRPVPIDRELIVRHLPVPTTAEAMPTAESFADMVMDRRKKPPSDSKVEVWRNVGLMPLSLQEIREFSALQGVLDPDALVADIQLRDAEDFAQRPQDLIELCSDWREHHRIRTHREQVQNNIATKLKPRTERKERAELSQEKAVEGASRLALAAMLTRKLTLRQSAESDSARAGEAALDVSKILLDWSAPERATLLERPLFGFASYGRVRFHHRSVIEFLAAKRLSTLLAQGTSIKAVKRLLFAETAQGAQTVRPSMRPVAAWMALFKDTVFDDIVAIDPAVVLDYGDPQSLRPAQRIKALESYVDRHGSGGWRGLRTPSIQVHRFASSELSETVSHLWAAGIENPEVRILLLQMIGSGRLEGCADIAHSEAMNGTEPNRERSVAIETLVQLKDARLDELAASLVRDASLWPDGIARRAVLDLFPTYLSVPRLAQILRRIREDPSGVGDLNYRLRREIEIADLSPEYLDQLRQGLTDIVIDGVSWEQNKFPHLRTQRPDLRPALVAACHRQALQGVRTEQWVTSSLLAIRLSKEDTENEAIAELRRSLAGLSPEMREAAFWNEDAFLKSLHQSKDCWHRVFDLSRYGGIRLSDKTDSQWVRKRLSDPREPLVNREMMLWAEILLLNQAVTDHRSLLETLEKLVLDESTLVTIIQDRLKPPVRSAELRRMEALNAKRSKQTERRTAKAHASWVAFWREIAQYPDKVFASDRAENTAWNLWQAVERSGNESRASGWNRKFIEAQFGSAAANRLRETMMAFWRKDKPTLRSERPEKEKNTFLVRWQLGLAGIAAEAEDPNWTKGLTEGEAELACRYVPMELSGFPSWLESLATEHPTVVDRILGEELSLSITESIDTDANSILLQNISYAPAVVATLFVARIRSWVKKVVEADAKSNNLHSEQNLRKGVEILLKYGSDEDRRLLEVTANQRLKGDFSAPFTRVLLPVLLHLNPVVGVDVIEHGLKDAAISKVSSGVQLFSWLFDRTRGGVGVDLTAPGFTPPLLLRLLRQAYRHIRISNDAVHEGSYSPDTRDEAERARNELLSALLSTTGAQGWAAKLEMANDPLFAHIKDRTVALAQEKAAEEVDKIALTESEFIVLDRSGEAPPATTEAMFALMRDRLDDIDDLLLQDISPRELWASITDEHVMRREITRALRDTANHSYTVDQEAVTADEKETDIRFRSTGSGQQGTIELKLGDRRTGTDLFNTINDQLLTKYMAADECRAGCLLITIAKSREWDHPQTGERINFEALIAVLDGKSKRLSRELGGAAKLMVKGLDLRPRLATEESTRAKC